MVKIICKEISIHKFQLFLYLVKRLIIALMPLSYISSTLQKAVDSEFEY